MVLLPPRSQRGRPTARAWSPSPVPRTSTFSMACLSRLPSVPPKTAGLLAKIRCARWVSLAKTLTRTRFAKGSRPRAPSDTRGLLPRPSPSPETISRWPFHLHRAREQGDAEGTLHYHDLCNNPFLCLVCVTPLVCRRAPKQRVIASSVFFQQNRCTIGMACAQAVALRGTPTTARRHVDAPRDLPPLNMTYDEHDRNVSFCFSGGLSTGGCAKQ